MTLRDEQYREDQLRNRIAVLPAIQRKILYGRMVRRLKDPDSYAVLNYLFLAGLHHFYLGRWIRGTTNLVVFLAGLVCLLNGQWSWGFGLLITITLIELPALFYSQRIVLRYNNDLAESLLAETDCSRN
ncbi:TM2 domain-containing protein [Porticoccus sp.]|uniref:TM2 domain-containing protein n=1 Tax=Porticoccus sp. TaxID=2024853 RepID=UPI003F6A0D91